MKSLETIAALNASRVFPAHHSLDIKPEIVTRMRDALTELEKRGELRHGGGTFDYGDLGNLVVSDYKRRSISLINSLMPISSAQHMR